MVRAELMRLKQPWMWASLSQLQRARIRPTPQGLVVGQIAFVKAALRQLGSALPSPDSYPVVLAPFLQRKVWRQSLAEVRADLDQNSEARFIKPAETHKGFTGLVLREAADPRLVGQRARQQVWCSDVVVWRSEWRCYVLEQTIGHLACYAGDPQVRPDQDVIRDAVVRYGLAGAPQGYALDVGVLGDGRTALVEVNDGFSLGAYPGTPPDLYTALLQARWRELVEKPPATPDAKAAVCPT